MNVPGFYGLELDVAGRYQTFDPGGDKAVPKVGIRWQPIDDQVTFRGSYGQGFIAPTLFQSFGPAFESNPSVFLQGENGQVTTETLANPNLKPSDTEQFGAGIVITPKNLIENLTLSADYYYVTEDHLAVADPQTVATSLDALGSDSPYAPGFTFQDGTHLTSNAPHQVTIDNWLTAVFPWQPFGALRTDGIDFAGHYVLPQDWTSSFGRISLDGNANVLLSYKVSDVLGQTPYYSYKGTYTPFQGLIPDWSLHLSLTWEMKEWTFVVGANYLPETVDPGALLPKYGSTEQGFTIDGKSYTIPSYYTIDLQLSYEFGKGKREGRQWYDGTKLTAGVLNVTNEEPPLIPDAVESNTDKNNYDVLGRFVYFEVSKKF
jgi:iron complex outermembrane receptor protein